MLVADIGYEYGYGHDYEYISHCHTSVGILIHLTLVFDDIELSVKFTNWKQFLLASKVKYILVDLNVAL